MRIILTFPLESQRKAAIASPSTKRLIAGKWGGFLIRTGKHRCLYRTGRSGDMYTVFIPRQKYVLDLLSSICWQPQPADTENWIGIIRRVETHSKHQTICLFPLEIKFRLIIGRRNRKRVAGR